MAFNSIEEILNVAAEKNQPLWEIIFEDDMEDSGMQAGQSLEKMKLTYEAMKDVYKNYDEKHTSASGLVGGDGAKMDKAVAEGAKISVRGLGKIKLHAINGHTKKDRISIIIHRYV